MSNVCSDCYSILGVARDATQDEIKSAYRTLAKLVHPDLGGAGQADATSNFIKIQEAYRVLSDPVRRREHDDRASLILEASSRDLEVAVENQEYDAGHFGDTPSWKSFHKNRIFKPAAFMSLLIALVFAGLHFSTSTERGPATTLQTAKVVDVPTQLASNSIDLTLNATTQTAKSDIIQTTTEIRNAPLPVILPLPEPDTQATDLNQRATAVVNIPRLDEAPRESKKVEIALEAEKPKNVPRAAEQTEASQLATLADAATDEPAVTIIVPPPAPISSSQSAMVEITAPSPRLDEAPSGTKKAETAPDAEKPKIAIRTAEPKKPSQLISLTDATTDEPAVTIIVPPPAPISSSQSAMVEITTSSPILKRQKRVAMLDRRAISVTGRRAENAGWQNYMAHVVSSRSKVEARAVLNRIRANHRKLVRGLSTRIASSTESGATVYTAGFGPLPTHKAAARLCQLLLATGEGDCVVWPPWSLK